MLIALSIFSSRVAVDINCTIFSFPSHNNNELRLRIKSSMLLSLLIPIESGLCVSFLFGLTTLMNSINKRRRPIPSGIPDTTTARFRNMSLYANSSLNFAISLSRPANIVSRSLIWGNCSHLSLFNSSSIFRAKKVG